MSEPATPHPPEHAPGPAAHAADPWPMVSDAVMRGLNHALSNRAAALSGLVGLVEPAEPPGQEVAELLGRETARLEETLRLYCLLARGQPRPAEPVLLADALGDALGDALALHAHHAGLADAPCAVEGDPAALPR